MQIIANLHKRYITLLLTSDGESWLQLPDFPRICSLHHCMGSPCNFQGTLERFLFIVIIKQLHSLLYLHLALLCSVLAKYNVVFTEIAGLLANHFMKLP